MNFITTVLLCALCALPFSAINMALAQQDGGIRGTIRDADNGHGLPGATIRLLRGQQVVAGTIANSRGEYTVGSITPGEYTFTVRVIGYTEHRENIRVAGGETRTLNAGLQPAPAEMTPLEIIGERGTGIQTLTGAAYRIDSRALQLRNPLGTQEVLGTIPGVSGFADDGIGNSRINIGIRGMNPRRSSRVLILEDGVPIEPALYIYPNMYYNPPAERIDEVEVIKGSAAILYGPQTMGGVINYITRRPRQDFGWSLQTTGGENGYGSVWGEIGGWGNDVFQPELQVLYKRGNGFRDNNDFEQYNGTFKLNILPDTNRVIYIKANVNYENSNATYTGLTGYSYRTNPNFNPKEFDNFKVMRAALDLMYTSRITDDLLGTTKVFASYFDRRWWREDDIFVRASDYERGVLNPVAYFEPGDLVRTGNGQTNHGNLRTFYVGGVEQTYEISHSLFGGSSLLTVGGRLYWDRFIDDKKMGDSPDARDGIYYTVDPQDTTKKTIVGQSHHYQTNAMALYVQEKMTFGDLIVAPGVRMEVFEQERVDRLQGSTYLDKSTAVLLPGIGANYRIGEMNLFGGVHRGFTPPSSGTLAIVNFGMNVESGGLDLESEKSWNYELGLRGAFSWMSFELSGFLVAMEDIVAAARGTAFTNLGDAETRGLEVGSTLYFSRAADLLPDVWFSYTWLQTEVTDGRIRSAVIAGSPEISIAGNELPYAPEHTLAAGLTKEFASGLSLQVDVLYVGSVYTDFENIRQTDRLGIAGPVASYTVFNASAGYAITDSWRVFASGKNIFDEIYIGSRLHSHPAQPDANISSGILVGPRRQVNIGVEYKVNR